MVARNVIYLMGALVYFCSLSMGEFVPRVFNGLLILRENQKLLILRENQRPEKFPMNVDSLDIYQAGYTELPEEALRVQELKIRERNLTKISGSAPRLRFLYLETPALKTVNLVDFRFTVLRSALWNDSHSVETLNISWLKGNKLRSSSLEGLTNLREFTLRLSKITTMPGSLFSYSPNLKTITISENRKLQYLKSGLFSGLTQLKSLVMQNNRLSASQLAVLKPLKALTTLKLNNNPLKDLCTDGGKSDLKDLIKLQELDLSNTGLTRICTDWQHDLPNLILLDLSRNNFKVVSADLFTLRPPDFPVLHINLTKSDVKNVSCSREDYEILPVLSVQITFSWVFPYMRCGCSWYWLWRIIIENVISESSSPANNRTCCDVAWKECHPEDELRKFVEYKDKLYYRARCEVISLDHVRRWPFPSLVTFNEVYLISCKPTTTYGAALRALNIGIPKALYLHDVPDNFDLAASLADLAPALQELYLYGPLHLVEFPLDLVSANLSLLEMHGPDFSTLKSEAVNVSSLKIIEDKLIIFNGTAPRLTELWAMAPLTTLPLAPALTTLTLYTADPPPLQYSELRTLNLHNQRTRTLPDGFLRGCPRLMTLVVTKSNFSVLPADLFTYTPDLLHLVLTDNKHVFFESNQLANLKKLLTLNLSNNMLRYPSLDDITQLTTLTELDLSDNPLVDLCPRGLSPLLRLRELRTLNLSNTMIFKFCENWKKFPNLTTFDLSNNDIRSIRCVDLSPQGVYNHSVFKIYLNNNPLEVQCTYTDHSLKVYSPPTKQRTLVYSDAILKCTCHNYWLSRILRERNSQVSFNATYESPHCLEMGYQCRMRSQCPNNTENCKIITFDDDWDRYQINGQPFLLRYDNGSSYTAWCNKTVLGDSEWPVFVWEASFTNVILHGCAPPPAGYCPALTKLNIFPTSLYLHDLPATSQFTYKTFPISLDTLFLGAASEVLQLPRGTLRGVRVRDLTFLRVTGEIPLYVNRLNLTYTGIEEIPKGNYQELIVIDDKISTLTGTSLTLQSMFVSARVTMLPSAPELSVLELEGVVAGTYLIHQYPKLKILRMRRLIALMPPIRFLRSSTQLQHFEMTMHNFITTTRDLFSYTPNLISIDLSDNGFKYFPRGLFAGLSKLETLNLRKNRLTLAKMDDLSSLVALRHLNLQENPLGSLCTGNTSVLFALKKLEVLELAQTNATHICADWITHMRQMYCIDLSHNAVHDLPCAALVAKKAPGQNGPFIALKNNPINNRSRDCSSYIVHEDSPKVVTEPTKRILTDVGIAYFIPTNEGAPCSGDWVEVNPYAISLKRFGWLYNNFTIEETTKNSQNNTVADPCNLVS